LRTFRACCFVSREELDELIVLLRLAKTTHISHKLLRVQFAAEIFGFNLGWKVSTSGLEGPSKMLPGS